MSKLEFYCYVYFFLKCNFFVRLFPETNLIFLIYNLIIIQIILIMIIIILKDKENDIEA